MNTFLKLLIALWVGSLWWMIVVANVIFDKVPTSYLAGLIAGQLFEYLSYFSLVVLTFVMFRLFKGEGWRVVKNSLFWISLFILFIVLINLFGIKPFLEALKIQALPKEVMESIFADRFSLWHGISSIAYLIHSLLATFLMLKWR
ncbi:DUF4149 domain-containing protein [Methylophilaceae bacterium]|jgi:hypothetical protein|nr:DUF4149 domain-containing protein [Methylophilaceae bacterium]